MRSADRLVVVAAAPNDALEVVRALTPDFVARAEIVERLADVGNVLERHVVGVVIAGDWAHAAPIEVTRLAQSTSVVVLVDATEEELRLRDRGVERVEYVQRGASGEHLRVLPHRLAERSRTHAALAMSRAVDGVDALVAYVDASLRIVALNRAYATWLGVRDHEPMIGEHGSRVLGEALFSRNLPYMQAALRGEVQHFEQLLPDAAGGLPRRVWTTLTPHIEDGQVCGFYVLGSDMSEVTRLETSLRASESKWRRLFEILPTGVSIVDAAHRIVDHNEALGRITNLSEAELKSGERATNRRYLREDGAILTVADYPSVRAMREGRVVENVEIAIEMEDGGRVWTSVSAAALGDEGAVVVTTDITAAKRAAAELEARRRQLARLAEQLMATEKESRRALAERLHDELQQLLVGAKIQLEEVSQVAGPLSARLAKIGEILTSSLETSRAITRDLAPPMRPAADLPAALRWLAKLQAERSGLVLHTSLPDHLAVSESNATLLFTGARELLLNVVKHSGVKEAALTLEATDNAVTLTIADAGRGFDPSATPLATSMGLGLFSIKERAELLGGRVAIDTAPGEGTRIRLSLPNPKEESASAVERRSGPLRAAPEELGEGTIRIVVVDDHAIVRKSVMLALARHDDLVIVGEASNGREALELVERVQPHVVLMDVTMPLMDGIEATRRVRSRWPRVRVIGLTMHTEPSIIDKMLQAGAEQVVAKGSEMDRLLETIRARRPPA